MLKHATQTAFERKCKRVTGEDNGFAHTLETKKQIEVCIRNWVESEKISESYFHSEMTHNYTPFIKKWVFSITSLHVNLKKNVFENVLFLFSKIMHKTQRVFRMHK